MKLKQSIRYQLRDYRSAILVFYIVILGLHAFIGAVLLINGPGSSRITGGISAFTCMFLFICGLVSLHDNLPMHLQNGISRRTMFLGRLAATAIIAAFMAVVDTVLSAVLDLFTSYLWEGGTTSLFNLFYNQDGQFGAAGGYLLSVVFSFTLLALASCLGYLIVAVFYRLPFALRWVVGGCAAVLLMFGVPVLRLLDDSLWGGALWSFSVQYLEPAAAFIEGNPFAQMGAWLLAAVVCCGLTWPLVRRMPVRR